MKFIFKYLTGFVLTMTWVCAVISCLFPLPSSVLRVDQSKPVEFLVDTIPEFVDDSQTSSGQSLKPESSPDTHSRLSLFADSLVMNSPTY